MQISLHLKGRFGNETMEQLENALCFRLLRHNDLQACMGVGGLINISRNLLIRMEAEGIHVKRYTKYVEFI